MNELTRNYMDIDDNRLLIVLADGTSTSVYPRDPSGEGFRILNDRVDARIHLQPWSTK